MGAQHKALQIQSANPKRGTFDAAVYLKRKGYSLKSAMYILTGRVL